MERIFLTKDYSISNIIKGGWHLSGGHGPVNEAEAIQDMRSFVEAGITTFDCADIYTGVEELIGKLLVEDIATQPQLRMMVVSGFGGVTLKGNLEQMTSHKEILQSLHL